jgi:hypothetical protein
MNNTSLYTADRATHLKIVVVALIAATAIAGIGIAARGVDLGTDILTAQRGPAIKAGAPVVWTARDTHIIR